MKKKAFICVVFIVSVFAGNPLRSAALFDSLPGYVFAFPFGIEDYKTKLTGSGEYYIWSQKKLDSWAQSRGFRVSQDSAEGGFQYNRAMVFFSPGITFRLKKFANQRASNRNSGWTLVLDLGMIRKKTLIETHKHGTKGYENIIRYEIWIDGIFYKKVEIGYDRQEASPMRVYIPYTHDSDVMVEIRLKNHPQNFGILYDAFLELN